MSKETKTNEQQGNGDLAVVSGSFYWIRQSYRHKFEPAKCERLYGTRDLYFNLTNGKRIKIEKVFDVQPLNYR